MVYQSGFTSWYRWQKCGIFEQDTLLHAVFKWKRLVQFCCRWWSMFSDCSCAPSSSVWRQGLQEETRYVCRYEWVDFHFRVEFREKVTWLNPKLKWVWPQPAVSTSTYRWFWLNAQFGTFVIPLLSAWGVPVQRSTVTSLANEWMYMWRWFLIPPSPCEPSGILRIWNCVHNEGHETHI